MAITVQWACATRQGPRQRNEDAVQVVPELAAALLADGMGGAAGGREASTLAVAAAAEFLARNVPMHTPPTEVGERLHELVAVVNQRVYQQAEAAPGLRGMGSTLVALLTRGTRYYCANVGDSRAYLLRDGKVLQLSKDHSLVQERVDAGLITAEQAAQQPDRNVLTRAIGTTPDVAAYLAEGEVRPGDLFVLTSDGVHGALDSAQLAAADREASPTAIATWLVEEAVAHGTRDNATAAVGRAEAPPGAEALERVLAYPAGDRSGGKTRRWLLAGVVLLFLATALGAVLALR